MVELRKLLLFYATNFKRKEIMYFLYRSTKNLGN